MYSGRQREVRERQAHAMLEERAHERVSLRELDDAPEFEIQSPWSLPLRGRASAA